MSFKTLRHQREYMREYRKRPHTIEARKRYWLRVRDRELSRRRQNEYGISASEIADIFSRQNGVCAVDGCSRKAKAIDHDHSTGKVRSALCSGCNLALGQLGESLARAEGLVAYMRVHGCTSRPERVARIEAPSLFGDEQ